MNYCHLILEYTLTINDFCNHLVKLRLIRPLDHTGTSRTEMAGKSGVELPDPVSKDPSAIREPAL